MAKASSKEVAKAEAREVPTLAEGMDLDELIQDSGTGPQMDLSDLGLPYIYLLQPMSPQANRANPKFIPGCEPGMFLNHVSGKVYDDTENGLMVVPCHYERKFVEWVDRDEGGGWVGDHPIESNIIARCKPDEKGRMRLPENNHLIVETAYQYALLFDAETNTWEQVCIPMKSTALKKNRVWNKLINDSLIPGTDKKAPRFLYPYQLRSVGEQKGENFFFNFEVERLPQTVTREVYAAAKRYYEAIEAGAVKRAAENDGETVQVTVVSNEPGGTETEEIPF